MLALIAYSNSFRAELAFDNQAAIQSDPRIRALTRQNLDLIWSRGYWFDNAGPGLYRPLTTLSYLVNYVVFGNGERPAGYHWINFMIHTVNALLVYGLGLAVFRYRQQSLALAALWAVHPVLTESVTNIVGRADLLAGFGVLAGILCHIKATSESGARKVGWLIGLTLAATIGIFSKENAAALIFLMLAYDLAFRTGGLRASIPGYAAAALPLVLFLFRRSQIIATSPVNPATFVDNPLVGVGFWQSRLTAIQVIGRYMGLILWPQSLSCDYSYNQIPLFRGTLQHWGDWLTLLALMACLAAAALAAIWYRRSRTPFFFVALFFLTLAPVANIAILIGTIMAERFLYLPAVGFLGCVVWAIYAAADRVNEQRGSAAIRPAWVIGVLCVAL